MNKLFPCLLLVVMAVALISCEEQADGPPIIGKKDLQLTSDIMTPEVLWSFGRVSDIQVSPDNKMVLFGISYYDKEQNKGNRDLYTIPVEGGEMKMSVKPRRIGWRGSRRTNDSRSCLAPCTSISRRT